MPVFHFTCECGQMVRLLLEVSEQDAEHHHKECGGKLTRTPSGFTSQTVEVLDNGIMTRRVERYRDIEQLQYERSHKDYKKD